MTSLNFSRLMDGAREFLESLRTRDVLFRFSNDGNITVVSNSLGLILGYGLYGANFLNTDKSATILSYLRNIQERKSGKFIDPMLEVYPTPHGLEHKNYLEWQSTYYAIFCLELAGLQSQYSLKFLEPILFDYRSVIDWIQSLNWSKPWRISNDIMFLLFFIHSRSLGLSKSQKIFYTNIVLDWLDAHQDSETGLWIAGKSSKQIWEGMGATYHFLPFYDLYNRPVCFSEGMFNSIRFLQQSDGLFHIEGGGGACSDMDATDMLLRIAKYIPSLNDQVSDILFKILPGLLDCQQLDGGFSEKTRSYCSRNHSIDINYGRWSAISYNICCSDIWSTWCRYKSVAQIYQYLSYENLKTIHLPEIYGK